MEDNGFTSRGVDAVEAIKTSTVILESIKLKLGLKPNQMTEDDYIHLYSETDYSAVTELFINSIRKTSKKLKEKMTNNSKTMYLENARSGNRKVSCKRVSNYPLFLAKEKSGIAIEMQYTNKTNATEVLINECFRTVSYEEEDLESLLARAEMPVSTAEDLEEEAKSHRHKFNRCTPRLSEGEKRELSLCGIFGKRYSKINAEYLKEKKKALSFDSPLNDISQDIDNSGKWLLSNYTKGMPNEIVGIRSLISKALSMQGVNTFNELRQMDSIMTTKGAVATYILTKIAYELALSLSQFTKQGEFILKKIRDYDVYLLIKPTNSDSHLFFSIIVPDGSLIEVGLVSCRQFIHSGSLNYTEFVSIDPTRLPNLVNLLSSFFVMVVDLARWSGINYHDLETPSAITDNFFLKHLSLRLLLHLENKACSEVAMTLWRYIAMNCLPDVIVGDGPWSSFTSHKTVFRSRLQIWIQKQQFIALEHMCQRNPKLMVRDPKETDEMIEHYSNLIDYVTLKEVSNIAMMVETFYLGYESDKNKAHYENSHYHLVEKICEEELKYDNVDHDYEGSKDHIERNPRPHEFSINIIRAISDSIINIYERKLGKEWQKKISNQVKEEMSYVTHEQLATLKATCTMTASSKKATTKTNINLARANLVQKVSEHLNSKAKKEERLSPLEHLPSDLSEIQFRDELLIYIFPKNQVGGIREIYVLTREERYCQFFIELISRILCSHIDFETMSNPDNKTKLLSEHYNVSKEILKSEKSCTYYASNDATRWNQRLVVKSFSILLCRILPAEFHPLIINTLNLWVNKRIMLPSGMQKFLLNSSRYHSRNTNLANMLLDGFTGQNEKLLKKSERVLNIQTGMMQGILHFTSSLLHAGLLETHKRLFTESIKKGCPDIKILTQDICSSDDSSSCITVLSQSLPMSKFICALFLHNNSSFCEYASVFDSSKKSSKMLRDLVEFNSVWYSCGSVIKAINKWSMAALKIPTGSSLLARQQHFSNLLTKVLESGAPIREVFLIQIAQAIFHYQMLGATTHGLFSIFKERISKYPDPNIGFFLMDHPLIAGIMGFDYNNYIAIKSSPQLRSKTASYLKTEYVELTPQGNMTTTATIRYGSIEKYKQFIDSCNPVFDWKEEIQENPEILYIRPINIKEELCKIMFKVSASGVSDSFTNSFKPIKVIASSIYLLSHHSLRLNFNKSVVDEIDGKKLDPKEKYSLLQLLNKEYAHEELSDLNLQWLFPSWETYNSVEEIVRMEYHSAVEVEWVTTIKGTSKLSIQNRERDIGISLMSLCTWKWFNQDIKIHKRMLDDSWEKARTFIPWLRDDIKETLEKSPFDTHIELHTFVSSIQSKTRNVNLNSVPIRGRTYEASIITIIQKDQWPKVLLTRVTRDETEVPYKIKEISTIREKARKLLSDLYLLAEFPLTNETWCKKANRLLTSFPEIDEKNITKLERRLATICFIANTSKHTGKVLTLSNLKALDNIRNLVVGEYTTRQKYNNNTKTYYGSDVWFGTFDRLPVRVHIEGDHLILIETNNINDILKKSYLIKDFCDSQNIKVVNLQKKNIMGYFYNGKSTKLQEAGSMNVPVVQVDLINMPPISHTPVKIDLPMSRRIIRVIIDDPNRKDNKVTICSLTPNFSDFILKHSLETTSHILEAWIEQKMPSERYLFRLINRIMDRENKMCYQEAPISEEPKLKRRKKSQEEPHDNEEQQDSIYKLKYEELCSPKAWLENWLRKSFKTAGLDSGQVLASTLLQESIEKEEPDISFTAENQSGPLTLDYGLLEKLIDFGIFSKSEDAESREEGEFTFLQEGFAQSEETFKFICDANATKKRESLMVLALNPSFVNMINGSDLGRSWWHKVVQGIVPTVNSDLANSLMRFLSIAKKEDENAPDSMDDDSL